MKWIPFSMIAPEWRTEFDAAVHRAMSGQRDREATQKACEPMDRGREKIRQQYGIQQIGVDLIRELRGALPEA